jgi:hypothetical protein
MKPTPKKHQVSKLFYNKWPVKLSLYQPGCYMVRHYGMTMALHYAQNKGGGLGKSARGRYNWEELLEFLLVLKNFIDEDIQLRYEGNKVSIFCRDKALQQTLESDLYKWLKVVYEPASDVEFNFLTSQTARKVVRDILPYDLYKFKVNIRANTDIGTRVKFNSWIKNYGDKVKVANHTLQWFENGATGYGWNPTIYVEDSATLSMIGLFLGNNVRSIEEFILRSSINIRTEQEELCQL